MKFIEKIKIFFNKIFKSREVKRLDTTENLEPKIESINDFGYITRTIGLIKPFLL